jgi:hypothetical protein
MRLLLLFVVLSLGSGLPWALGELQAQDAVVRVDENVRFEPQGVIVARLQAGTPVRVESRDGPWSRITFEGLVWENSLQLRDGGSFDLIVSAAEGENLRAEPAGAILGRVLSGTLLNEVSRSGGWIRVRRTAWMWSASLQGGEVAATDPAPAARAPAPVVPPAPATPPGPTGPRPSTPVPTPPVPTEVPAETPATDWVRAGPRGSAVLAAPDGDTLGVARQGVELRVTGREGNWARVRMEGWVWLPSTGAAEGGLPSDVILRDVTPAGIARDPERYRGRLVTFTVQHISVERAEVIRTDFLEGEPFLLTRSVEADRTFVYLAIPDELLPDVMRLQPLERLVIVGRVRAGAASLTGNPVLDLVEFRRVR